MKYSSIEEMIGHTPLLELNRLSRYLSLPGHILAKLEYQSLSGSVKDRTALYLIRAAEQSGQLSPGGTILEATSGNMGIALCAVGSARGYHVVIVMPDNMTVERQRLIRAYGGELHLTPGALGMSGAAEEAARLHAARPGSVWVRQFENPANCLAHEQTTAPEIWEDIAGKIDVFVAGVGTAGTLTGAARFLKAKNPAIEIVAVEPASSPVLQGGAPAVHGLQGIGANFIPPLYSRALVDGILSVTEQQADAARTLLAQQEGIFAGISSGAALHSAVQLAQSPAYAGKQIVVLLPDSGERYLSTTL